MCMLNCLMFVGLLVFVLFVVMVVDDDVFFGEFDVIICQEGDKIIQEYCVNGFFYVIKVVFKYGKFYFLVCVDGSDGNFICFDQLDKLIL